MTQSLSQSDVTLGPFSRLFIFKECDGLTSDFNVEICEIKRLLRKLATQQINCPVALVTLRSFNNLCEYVRHGRAGFHANIHRIF